MVEKHRLIWLDNLKGFLILLVVLGHCIQYTSTDFQSDIIFRYIYSFHMPLFVFASGYACYRPNVKWGGVKRRLLQLIIPFLIWTAIITEGSIDRIIQYIIYPELGLWFLWVLFFISAFHTCCCRLACKFHVKEEMVCILVAFLLLSTMRVDIPFGYRTIAKFFVYYIIGFYSRKHFENFEGIKSYVAIISICVFGILAFFSSQKGAPTFMPEGSSVFYGQIYNMAVSFIAIFAFVTLFAKYINERNILGLLGQLTLGIYGIHRIVISLFPYQYSKHPTPILAV